MVKAVVGANWGDEGKGKITDMLAKQADIIVRFQGGANAGHTIVNDYGKFALHTLPSGVTGFPEISSGAEKSTFPKWLKSFPEMAAKDATLKSINLSCVPHTIICSGLRS